MIGSSPAAQQREVLRMRAVLSLPLTVERLVDQAFPGREASVRNEAMRQIWRWLQTEPKASASIPPDRPRRRWR